MQLTGLAGKAAFVTGAAGGIGRAVVDGLVASGVRVFATDRQAEPGWSAAEGPVRGTALDISDERAVQRVIAEAETEMGGFDFGVNVAGILDTTPVADLKGDVWRRVFDVNCHGAFFVCQALAARMAERRQGSIVVVGSNAAGIPRKNMAAYAASKAAATMFVRCLGLEVAEHGVRCNIVAPGSTLTPMQTGMWTTPASQEQVIEGDLASYRTGIPLKKLAMPEDIANAVLFLLSDQAGHITMADLYVDGGATLRG
ncbi:2,3-dihydro-2,3-dihydroxybenzoate dehydrogenase [Rhizobium cremeum]|uniref:2,3-dihydro-2,3-dihydroxybenzoate dehydrogenase n=1 Tax=Rhizobium cremeum TaxID=2813827 RepID=UPI001FD4399B|nr:2,3-dihydro-2,3-dihydroxybenzoate dehydrogenase [Rhizobium cremeum]MCJ7995431.1 2,3-dihydro-2,3-dihydroxybenzoate dehydrogenase [Rhizobium cremeum]MCJ8000929.1 2,3-dihydro-2,3-dihydroxybenzoate dehydrogenase [Rhizobium cremeum]